MTDANGTPLAVEGAQLVAGVPVRVLVMISPPGVDVGISNLQTSATLRVAIIPERNW